MSQAHPASHPDWQLIVSLGGPAKVAELLGFTGAGRVQRVQNWKSRGIPSHVKVLRPDLFLLGSGQAGQVGQAAAGMA